MIQKTRFKLLKPFIIRAFRRKVQSLLIIKEGGTVVTKVSEHAAGIVERLGLTIAVAFTGIVVNNPEYGFLVGVSDICLVACLDPQQVVEHAVRLCQPFTVDRVKREQARLGVGGHPLLHLQHPLAHLALPAATTARHKHKP